MEKEQKITTGLSLSNPEQTLKFAGELKQFITEKGLSVKIQNKDYINVEGWQFAGMMLGLYPVITKLDDLSHVNEFERDGKRFKASVYKYQATAELRSFANDKILGIGIALCSNEENTKRTFAEYAISSMAQTRAIGKAYRNLIGFLVKAAGFEATPSEEMAELEAIGRSIN
jgi:hypothetical protein